MSNRESDPRLHSADGVRGDESWIQEVDRLIQDRHSDWVSIRRQLHMHPELSGEEVETTRRIEALLHGEELATRRGPDNLGLIVDLESPPGNDAPRMALRADMDALAIHDAKKVEYRSRHDGIMHACGHDAHSTILVAALAGLADLRRREAAPFPWRVRAIFQGAEETAVGARQMVEHGAVDDCAAILAVHVDSSRDVGKMGLRTGILTANCDDIQITIRGEGGHAARPHETSDALFVATLLLQQLYAGLPRGVDSRQAAVVTFGQLQAGHSANVIPSSAHLAGTMRTLDRQVHAALQQRIQMLAHSIALTWGVSIDVQFGSSCPSVNNDPHLIALLGRAAARVVGEPHVQTIPEPSLGGEDFAFYLDRIPGALMRVGCASNTAGHAPLHHPLFDVDERALPLAARTLVRSVLLWSASQHRANNQPAPLDPPAPIGRPGPLESYHGEI
jgi:amidohydrolase